MTTDRINRRRFLQAGAAAAMGATMGGAVVGRLEAASPAPLPTFKHALHKAMPGDPTEQTFKTAKELRFEAVETGKWDVAPDDAKRARDLAHQHGLRVHSVVRAWVPFDAPEGPALDKHVASVERALRAAQGYGADNILVVTNLGPHGMAIPNPWEFDIDVTDEAGHISRVVKGDNSKFKKYIEYHNNATDASHRVMKRLFKTIEQTGVVVGIENVWNNLWVRPELYHRFIQGHGHPMVRPFFDVANHVKYGITPDVWVRTLGDSIIKVHIKEYKLNPGGHSGEWVTIRSGGVDWPAVRRALDDVGFDRFGTLESHVKNEVSMAELSRRFDLIVEGV